MQKKSFNLNEIHPLTLNIERIYNLPLDIPLEDDSSDGKSGFSQEDIREEMLRRKQELKELLMGDDQNKGLDLMKFIDNLLNDNVESESIVSSKENLVPQISGNYT